MSRTEVNSFIAEELQPTESFHREVNRDMDFLAQYLKNQSGLHIGEVVKGGSLSKGTAIKGKADLDIVIFMNDFENMDDFRDKIGPTINDLEKRVRKWIENNGHDRVEIEGTTRHALKLRIRKSTYDDFVDVDLLPSINLLDLKGKHGTYQALNGMSQGEREYFSGALAPLQIEFVKPKASSVKSLLRLVKYWRKTQFPQGSFVKFPTSYVLELLTIHAWEQDGSPLSFNVGQAFKSIMMILEDNQTIDARWGDNYNLSVYSYNQPQNCPCILDPANPFNNVCATFKDSWPEVSRIAREALNKPFLDEWSRSKYDWS